VTLRAEGGDEKGSFKSETVKYDRESQGTRTRERLRRQGPATYTYKRQTRPLVREGAPQKQDHNCQTDRQSQCDLSWNDNIVLVLSPRVSMC
jgi:hypothetical protein